MYQGKNPTAINSQKMLSDSLNELLQEQEYKDISVSEICNHSGISRQTFYTLFGSKDNLLLYQLKNAPYVKKPFIERSGTITLKETCENYSKYVIANYQQLKMLIDNNLMELLNKLFYETISDCPQSYVDLDDDERECVIRFMSAGLCSLTQEYVRSHDVPVLSELIRLSYKIMSGNIYKT